MNDALPSTTYVSRILPLSPAVARQVFDLARVDRQLRSAEPDRWTVTGGAVHLRLHGPGHVEQGGVLLRSCPATMRLPGPRLPVRVELELNAWSSTRSEVGLRLLGSGRRPRAGYLDAAVACVEALASELELRGLLALHPAHGTGSGRAVAASAWL